MKNRALVLWFRFALGWIKGQTLSVMVKVKKGATACIISMSVLTIIETLAECVCVYIWSRQQVLKWVLKEPSVLRLVSNPVYSGYMKGTGCGCFCLQLLNIRQCVCLNMLKERCKPKTHTPTYLFVFVHTVCACARVCVGVFASWDTTDWRLFDWQLNLCLFSSVDLFVLFFCLPHTSKATKSQLAGRYFFPFSPVYTSKYCTVIFAVSSIFYVYFLC